eukprot:363560-Chlamydomonas_euryale.AAC.9
MSCLQLWWWLEEKRGCPTSFAVPGCRRVEKPNSQLSGCAAAAAAAGSLLRWSATAAAPAAVLNRTARSASRHPSRHVLAAHVASTGRGVRRRASGVSLVAMGGYSPHTRTRPHSSARAKLVVKVRHSPGPRCCRAPRVTPFRRPHPSKTKSPRPARLFENDDAGPFPRLRLLRQGAGL